MPGSERKTLYYTVGNHMHWVDMQWLWGWDVLPSSIRDMLHMVREAGIVFCVNFDGVGYERLAAECPAALADLREAVRAGTVEVVGASYGQPYGLFHGPESNIRQRLFGVRAVLRHLGTRPRAFWEEEFDFCPQLPQILRRCGYEAASLFFQWTWHTPEVPMESASLILWEGVDGSRLPTAPRNGLNLHQWPEDFAPLFESELLRSLECPAVVQWVELMPSPDWMCRSEVLLPKLRQFLNDDRFEVRPVTLSGLIEALHSERTPVRRYTMDDVFHGMSLGKNGDDLRRRSFLGERTILAAEAISAFAGLFGRPYAGWDVYPDWELDEAWRELLVAQHHDNDECEGLCGAIGRTSYARAQALAEDVLDRTLRLVADRAASVAGELVVFNQLGWPRDIVVDDEGAGRRTIVPQVPAFGVARGPGLETEPASIEHAPRTLTLRSREVTVIVDLESGVVDQIISPVFPDGALHPGQSVGTLEMIRDGRPEIFSLADVRVEEALGHPVVYIDRRGEDGATVHLAIALAPLDGGVDLSITADGLPPPDPRMHAGLQTAIRPAFPFTLLHDTPYAIAPLEATASYRRKYPTGDWMTSPQVFERIVRPFTAQSLVDLLDTGADRGLLYLHDGSQAFFRTDAGIRNLLTMNDPWDESYFLDRLRARIRLIPHGALTNADRARLAAEFNARPLWRRAVAPLGDVPAPTGGLRLEARSVLATAFHRECARAGEHLPDWAGHTMERPYVVRLAEFDGVGERVTLHVPGRVRAAARTNLLGEHEAALKFSGPSADSDGAAWSTVRLEVGPHEIATLMLDLERGRKQPRDLDAHRRVWATVHREGVL